MRESSTGVRLRRSAAAVAVCGVLVMAGTGCGKASDKVSEKIAEKSIEQAGGGKVDIDSDGDGVTIKNDDGEYSTGSAKKLPDNWPSDILPVPDGFEIGNVTNIKTGSGESIMVTVTGDGDVGELIDSYADGFKSNGLEVALQSTTGDGGMVMGTKDATSYQVTASVDDDGVTVQMTTVTDATESTD